MVFLFEYYSSYTAIRFVLDPSYVADFRGTALRGYVQLVLALHDTDVRPAVFIVIYLNIIYLLDLYYLFKCPYYIDLRRHKPTRGDCDAIDKRRQRL